jgi:hypothetical protein
MAVSILQRTTDNGQRTTDNGQGTDNGQTFYEIAKTPKFTTKAPSHKEKQRKIHRF